MFIILSPSKTMNTEASATLPTSLPRSKRISKMLLTILKSYNKTELMKLMKISEKLADGVFLSYQYYKFELASSENYAAIFAYTGEVFNGLNAKEFTVEELAYAQQSLRILSGFLGILKPLDAVMPYRLEMNTRLITDAGTNLYHIWRKEITDLLIKDFKESKSKYLLDLASGEYSQAIDFKQFSKPVIHVDFYEMRNGEEKFISFSAKRARGLLANYVIRNKITAIEDLLKFDVENYKLASFDEVQLTIKFVKQT